MNDLALYQLERALDALTKMTRILRDEKIALPGNDLNREDPFQFTLSDGGDGTLNLKKTPICYKSNLQYTDEELNAMCDQAERDQLNLEQSKEQIYKNYRAAIDEYNKLNEKYKSLEESHLSLQDLFYAVDSELDELKVNYQSVQDNYHKVVRQLSIIIDRNFELEQLNK